MSGFNNKEVAAAAGRKSRRGANKATVEAREMIANLTDLLYEDLKNNLDDLDTKDKAQLFPKLLEYRVAKLRSVESKVQIDSLSEQQVSDMVDKILADG